MQIFHKQCKYLKVIITLQIQNTIIKFMFLLWWVFCRTIFFRSSSSACPCTRRWSGSTCRCPPPAPPRASPCSRDPCAPPRTSTSPCRRRPSVVTSYCPAARRLPDIKCFVIKVIQNCVFTFKWLHKKKYLFKVYIF